MIYNFAMSKVAPSFGINAQLQSDSRRLARTLTEIDIIFVKNCSNFKPSISE